MGVPGIPNTKSPKARLRGLHYFGRGHEIQFTYGGRREGLEEGTVNRVDTSTVWTDWVWASTHVATTDLVWVPLYRLGLQRGCQNLSIPTTSICNYHRSYLIREIPSRSSVVRQWCGSRRFMTPWIGLNLQPAGEFRLPSIPVAMLNVARDSYKMHKYTV